MRQSQLQSTRTYFILKQLTQWLYQLKRQIIRQSTDIVMRFDNLCCLGAALHDIRINGPLCQEIDTLQLTSLFLKHTDKLRTDNLTLLFRLCHILQLSKKPFACIHINQIRIHLILKHFNYTFRFPFAHQPMIDMHTIQLLTDCL